MNRVDTKIEELLQRSKTEELSITQIRKELEQSKDFSQEEISSICREYSDAEMLAINEPGKSILSYFESVYIAYFLSLVFSGLVVFACYKIYELQALKELGEVPNSMVIWRYFLLAGALMFLVRNLYRVINHLKSKK